MCGICGFVDAGGRPVDPEVLVAMRDTLTYRGPDAAGLHVDGALGLGHRRLAIIDTVAGGQPMTTADGALTVVFNGEIYNYLELRQALSGAGGFRTASDTEVILAAYRAYGPACVGQFNGMFAIALWEKAERRLWLARDRVGIKPLYYAAHDDVFVFASELKALLRHPSVPAEIDPDAIDQFMTYGYVESGTIFKNIHRLPAGHTLTWQDGKVTLRQYWDVRFAPDRSLSDDEHTDRAGALLSESVRLQLRSDVPNGVLLSGGLDSSTIAALVAREAGRVATFSVGFDHGPAFNELAHARLVATAIGSDHHEVVVSEREFESFIPRFAYHMDEPVTEAAGIPLFFVSQLAARHVKVVLSGEGADELFGGYPIYGRMALMENYRRLVPGPFREALSRGADRLNPGARISKYLDLARVPLAERYQNPHLYDVRESERVYTPGFHAALPGRPPRAATRQLFAPTVAADTLSRMLYADTKSWLPNDILIKADRMSMACSIELRVPFLDHRLVECAARMPSHLKRHRGETKRVLRRIAAPLLPASILTRGKMGFPTPIAAMIRGRLAPYVRDLLGSQEAVARGYFNSAVVSRLVDEHVSGRADHAGMLWRLVVLEEWHRQIGDRQSAGLQRELA